MPKRAPAKVRISPKATSTDESISPAGGTMKPPIIKPAPTAHIATAAASCTFPNLSFITFLLQSYIPPSPNAPRFFNTLEIRLINLARFSAQLKNNA